MRKSFNNWYVITGAPCSGKTTTLQAIEAKGYKVIYEAARKVIDEGIAAGKTLEEIRKDELDFQRKVLRLKLSIEKQQQGRGLTFFERGIPDSYAYYHLRNASSDRELQLLLKQCHYKKIFLLDRLDYQKDYARTEDDKTAQRLHVLLKRSYKKIHADIITVPVMSIKERVNYILDNLNS